MRRSIATVCLSGGLAEKLQAIAAAGFDAVEIFENDLLNFDGSPREVRRMAEDLGLEIALYQPFRDFEAVPAEILRRNLDRPERKFDLMGDLGAPMMLVCSNVSPSAIDDEALAAEQLAQLADRAARHNIRIGYEALAWGAHVRHVEQVWRIVRRADHPHLGVLLDSFHMLALGDDPAVIDSIPGERIFFVQIADAPIMKLDPLSWSRHYRCFPGQGELDLATFMRKVLETGYTGPLSLEIFNDEFRGGSARQIARDGYRSLLFVEEAVRRAPAGDDTGAPHRRVSLFDPPPPTRLGGISFLEFAVDETAQNALATWLERFGFQRLGQHRRKAVTLLRAGGVNLVLNAEPDSFAHSFFLLHGPAICAIGLRTDDAAQALGRATDYRCARFDGRVGPNDLNIPAVRAPDGSLLYFVDESVESGGLYEIEFDLTAQPEADMTAPDSVDHVAVALPSGQMDSWVLYYRAVLGLQAAETLVLPDPYGLVRSRAVIDAARTVRFPLNISLGRDTSTARSVTTQLGAGVHHIAFACDDVKVMARRLAAAGAPILKIPENYYQDLAARFGLADEAVDELMALNLLYDRVGDAEFLHLYSETFQDRFFFEYVQRIGGYDDYGAPNASVRMAAHQRLRRSEV